ncbi:glucose-1-phosphate cytidylyltransferase [Taibaiella sp. KBW10]|uniref:glucose-1-phosphate cytidylyltransferase n=1 Tax=Taibaiella sp. KBW10 TaxID=2153357 RepID=UPI000F5AC5FE|nr:glucose-1-phosphate cytidylyltransferase [Taibaiella sp. KBW10]RQO31561.1 glucose-1-phosphate cytidylyltransferase [Taibaiella sp. KBW10]
MKVVLFAGGRGTRISEESQLRPKPMIEIGGKPMLWHIMKTYAHYGHNEFIICLGYKGWLIKEYFANYFLHNADMTVDLRNNSIEFLNNNAEPFKVTMIDTGLDTMTAGRLKRVLPYTNNEPFLLTYGDGLIDADINQTIDFHKQTGKICTMTSIQAGSRFGVIKMQDNGIIESFEEKPKDSGSWINAGYFVLQPEIKDYLQGDMDDIMWETEPMANLAADQQIAAYKHHGFWKCMDTLREKEELEAMWEKGAKWKCW